MSRYLVLLPAPEQIAGELAPSAQAMPMTDLRAACERFAARGGLIKFRRLAE